MKINRRHFVGGMAAGATLAVTGRRAFAQSKTKIRVGNIDIGPFVPMAYTKKLADKYDLDIEIIPFRRGLEAAQALKARQIDVAVGGLEAAISAVGAGTPAIVVSGLTTRALAWVGRSDMQWNAIEDIKGKRFGCIHGVHELVARTKFEQHGITVSEEAGKADVQVVFIPNSPGLVNALKIRELDATSAPEPFPARAVLEGYAVPFLKPFDTVLGDLPRAVFMHREYHDANPEASQRFVNAVVEATKVFRDDPQAGTDFALNDALKDAITEEDWNLALDNLGFNVELSAPLVQAHIDQMHKFGMIRETYKAEDISDLAMLDNAIKAVGW